MKRISDIIATVLLDCNVEIATCVPGYGATETFTAFGRLFTASLPFSFHEEAAYTIAHGAALAGQRSVSLMKSHGAAKAANSMIDSLSAGTTAGMVTIVFDDIRGAHSDSIFDIDAYLAGSGVIARRLNQKNVREEITGSFALSERLRLPVALVVEADLTGQDVDSIAEPVMKAPTISSAYERDIHRHLVCPLFSGYQRQVLDAKVAGADWRGIERPSLPSIPDDLPDRWRVAVERYIPFFTIFKEFRGSMVTGDTGTSSLFALPPFDCVDVTTYMGGSVPLAVGAFLAGFRDVWGVTGDFSFIAAGHLGLPEAVQRGIPLKLVIVDNGSAQATGGQPIPSGMLDRFLIGYRGAIREVSCSADSATIRNVVREAADCNELRIIVARC